MQIIAGLNHVQRKNMCAEENVQVIDNQGVLRLALRTCRPSKADLCAWRIAKSALDGRAGTISGDVLLTSILMSGQLSHRAPAE